MQDCAQPIHAKLTHECEDSALVKRLAKEQIPLTVCPLSNIQLRVFTLAKNAFTASFLSDEEKERYIAELDQAMN
jgi:adenosine deaminase